MIKEIEKTHRHKKNGKRFCVYGSEELIFFKCPCYHTTTWKITAITSHLICLLAERQEIISVGEDVEHTMETIWK